MNVVLNKILIDKLESISFDIKYYINTNASIANSEGSNVLQWLSQDDIQEVKEIRTRIKKLAHKLKTDGKF